MKMEMRLNQPLKTTRMWENRIASILPYLLFFGLAVWSLRNVLALPGIIGHVWDWGIPAFAGQSFDQTLSIFWVWDDSIAAGNFNPLKSLYFAFLVFPTSTLGGEFQSKFLPLVFLWGAGSTMYLFAHNELQLNHFWATIAGAIYMLSPVPYVQLVAGYLNLMLAYTLFPILLLLTWQILRTIDENSPLPLDRIVATGVVLGLEQALHSAMLVLASIAVLVTLVLAIRRCNLKRIMFVTCIVFSIGGLMNINWVLSFGSSYLSSGAIFHGGGSEKPLHEITAASITQWRQQMLDDISRPMQEAIRMHSDVQGVNTEYQFPSPPVLGTLWMFLSSLLPLGAFGILLRYRKLNAQILSLVLIGLIGVTLVAGTREIVGATLFQFLKQHALPIWAEFAVTPRAMPLLALAYCALIPTTLQHLTNWLQAQIPPNRFVSVPICIAGLLAVGLWTMPWLDGDVTNTGVPNVPMNSYTTSSDDQAVYDFLKNNPNDARMVVIPPPGIWGASDAGWTWDVGSFPPRPKFLASSYGLTTWAPISYFGLISRVTQASKLLGLANVEYVVYPHARFFDGKPVQSTYDVQLARQNLTALASSISGTTFYSNKKMLPRIYASTLPVSVDGSSNLLSALATTPYFAQFPALFFSEQQSSKGWNSLGRQTALTLAPIDLHSVLATWGADLSKDSPAWSFAGEAGASRSTGKTVFIAVPSENSLASSGTVAISHPGKYVVRASTLAQPAPSAVGGDAVYLSSVNLLDEIPRQNEWQVVSADFFDPSVIEPVGISANTRYDVFTSTPSELNVRVQLGGEAYVDITPSVQPFDLRDYPQVKLTAQVQDPSVQLVQIRLGLDFDGDGLVDVDWVLPFVPRRDAAASQMDAFSAAKNDFPGKPNYRVIATKIRLTQRPNVDEARVSKATLYDYALKEVRFFSENPVGLMNVDLSAWSKGLSDVALPRLADNRGLALMLPTNQQFTARLRRDLPASNAQIFPLYLIDYQVDGASTLAVNLRLLGTNSQGGAEILPLEARLLNPFSSGTLIFDANNKLTFQPSRVELTISRLLGETDLRPTTVTLTQFRVARQTYTPLSQAQPPVPELNVDGVRVGLEAMRQDANRSNTWFASQEIDLTQGSHTLSIGYADVVTPYRMGIIEVAPTQVDANTLVSVAPTVSFRRINPTRFVAHIENATQPFFLVFSESYHPDWNAFVQTNRGPTWHEQSVLLSSLIDHGRRLITGHYLVNSFANSWYIEQTGSYDVVIEFAPQMLYEVGLGIVALTLIGILVMVLWNQFASNRQYRGAL